MDNPHQIAAQPGTAPIADRPRRLRGSSPRGGRVHDGTLLSRILRSVRGVAIAGIGAIVLVSSAPAIQAVVTESTPGLSQALADDGHLRPETTDPSAPPSPTASIARRMALSPIPVEPPVAFISSPAIGLTNVAIYDRGLNSHGDMLIAGGYAITHFTGSAHLGYAGNAILYGHDDIFGGVFRHLDSLKDGDMISLLYASKTYTYKVKGSPAKIGPSDLNALIAPGSGTRLTLFTCYPTWTDDQRIVVGAPIVQTGNRG
jgi:sortase A